MTGKHRETGGVWREADGIGFWGGPLSEPGRHAGWRYAVSGRRGGGSPAPWASLNMSKAVGDDPDRVEANRRRFLRAAGFTGRSPVLASQVHGRNVAVVEKAEDAAGLEADGLVSALPGVTLAVLVADCTPVFLYDARRGVIAAVHAGWRGTVLGTAAAAVGRMQERFGSSPGDLEAVIGPRIGACCYEVDEPVKAAFDAAGLADALVPGGRPGRWQLDLGLANRRQLERAGLDPERISTASLCTSCSDRFFSHRRDGFPSGRMLAVVELGEGDG